MKYVFVVWGMLLAARPITLSLSVINRQSVHKNLGLIFKPITIKDKYKKIFFGKWNRDFFDCDGIPKISLIVLILLPLILLMYIFVLLYFVIIVISILMSNETLMLLTYEKIGFYVVMYTVFLGILTTIFSLWSYTYKQEKVTIQEQKEAIKNLNDGLKKTRNQRWYYPLWENLMQIAYFSNDEKGEYWFKKSQMSMITNLVKQSSKKATINLEFDGDKLCCFVVKDITNNADVFKGLIQKDN